MSLCPQAGVSPIPEQTVQVARAAFPRGNPCLLLRDRLGTVFNDTDFADLYPALGQPAYAPWRLALVTLMQFREGLSDRQAADAVRGRIDWKYLLALELADAGFDHSVLCEFRARLLRHEAGERLLGRVLDAAREGGMLKARGRQRTDSTHVLAAVRDPNRLELLAETLRAALNAIAAIASDWLCTLTPPEWQQRYGRRVEDMRLPETAPKREAYACQVGADGYRLLDALADPKVPLAVGTSMLSVRGSRERSRKPCALLGCAGLATVACPKRAYSILRRRLPSISTVWRPGLPEGRSPLPVSRVSPRLLSDQ